MEATFAQKLSETESKLKIETKALQKKVTLAEKSIKEKLKTIQKQNIIEEKEILTSSTA